MYQYCSPIRFIIICFVLYIVLFIIHPLNIYQLRIFYQTLRPNNNPNQNLVLLSLNSLIRIHLEADITPFIKDKNSNQQDVWRSMASVGIKTRSSDNETLFLIISELWQTIGYHPKGSYLYIEALNSNYRKISYNWSTIVIPSIISNLSYPRMINTHNNQMIFAYFNQQRKMELYNPFTHHRTSLLLENNLFSNIKRTLTPFMKNNKLYFVYSYKPLNILQCSKDPIECKLLSKIQPNDNFDILQDGTQLVQFRNTDYFVGIASISVSCNECTNFSRPHLIVLSTISNEFRLVYVSKPLILGHLPIFAPLSMLREENSTDFCYGIIRRMIPGFIIDWEWPNDKLSFTLSVNHKKTFLISLEGIEKIIQSLVENDISHGEHSGVEYCEYLSNLNKLKYQRIRIETQNLKANVIKDIIDSPTYPSYRIVSNTYRNNMKRWIADDSVNYGLIGRYLTDYNSQQVNNLMIDAGGNHGMYSLYGAMLNQTVHVFEVLPKYWIVIEESLRINVNIGKMIVLHKCGVSDQYNAWNVLPDDGTTRLIYREMNNKSVIKSDNLTVIEAYPLDDFIFQRISVMKIDVEGFEIRALKGALRAIRFFGVGAILIEITPFRWNWSNMTIEEGISVLEYVTSIGHYSSYVIARNDTFCPVSKISSITGIVETKNLTMMSMSDGHLENVPQIYQFTNWATIITHMKSNDWGCNFWLESSLNTQRISIRS